MAGLGLAAVTMPEVLIPERRVWALDQTMVRSGELTLGDWQQFKRAYGAEDMQVLPLAELRVHPGYEVTLEKYGREVTFGYEILDWEWTSMGTVEITNARPISVAIQEEQRRIESVVTRLFDVAMQACEES